MKLRRVVLLLVVGLDVLLLLVLWPILRGPTRRVDDRVNLIPTATERRYNEYLGWVENESGIDVRIVLTPSIAGNTPEQFALATMRELGVGRKTGGRGILVLYDTSARTMRIEVGPRLEGILPDAFVGYLVRQHLDPVFGTGRPEVGIRTTLFMLHWRIRMARLGEEYDPSFEEYMRDERRLAVGGGASGRVGTVMAPTPLAGTGGDSALPAVFRPQPSVEKAYRLQEKWLALGCRDLDVPLYTPASRRHLHTLPLSPAFCAYLLAGEYGRRYRIDERGDLAFLYYTDDPFISPHFFRRSPEGWQVDIAAEVANTQEAVGAWYTWRLRPSGDDFSRVFADLYTPMPMPHTEDFYRVAGGDNRALVIRGNSQAVESELAPRKRSSAESFTDGVPGVEYLTVRQAAARIRGTQGKPAVVLLYGTWNQQTRQQFPEIVRSARACRERGMEFLAFHTDPLPRVVEELPGLLRRHDAPFPAVQLYRWRKGMLKETMEPLGISIGTSWLPPLVAVLDAEGRMVWQAQGVTDWGAVERIVAEVAGSPVVTP